MVTSSFESAVDPTASAVDDPTSASHMTVYERNFMVMLQIYDDTKPGSESHMVKLLKVTHDVRRSKINSSALSTVAIKKQYPFFGYKKWVRKIH